MTRLVYRNDPFHAARTKEYKHYKSNEPLHHLQTAIFTVQFNSSEVMFCPQNLRMRESLQFLENSETGLLLLLLSNSNKNDIIKYFVCL